MTLDVTFIPLELKKRNLHFLGDMLYHNNHTSNNMEIMVYASGAYQLSGSRNT